MTNQNQNGFKYLHIVAMFYVSALIISNTIAVKIISIGSLAVPAAIICFPISYIINDVLVEVYGYRKARQIIWGGFICLALMSILYIVATNLQPAPFWDKQSEFESLLGLVPRITIASFIAYLVGSFLNAWAMSKMKIASEGKQLWKRTIGSTILGEGADSIIFNLVAFLGIFSLKEVAIIALTGFLLKTAYEIIATPFTYWAVNSLKRAEGVDVYDNHISYNPFKLTDKND